MPHSDFTVRLDQVIALSLKNPAGMSVSIAGREGSEARFVRLESEFSAMFHIQTWHKLYAGALLETDLDKLFVLIGQTEMAILGRYIKLIAAKSESDEILDLQNAITVLLELREVNQIGRMAPQLVV